MHTCKNRHKQIYATEYQIFQLKQEARLYKEIKGVDPALHARLSENKLREVTAKDDTLNELTKVIQQGWPELRHKVLLFLRVFGHIEMSW